MIGYSIIDLDTYKRKAHLEYFMSMTSCQTGLTANVDVTLLRDFCKKEGCSFFLAFMHIVALSADSIPQFRQRLHRVTKEERKCPEHSKAPTEGPFKDLEIREYEESPTSNTESSKDDMYCYCTNFHHMPWKDYISEATRRQAEARNNGTLDEDPEIEAFYFPTCVPWIHYTDCIHPWGDCFDSNPRFSWGRFEEDFKGRLMMPVTVRVHHGLVDGLQIAKFYENLDANIQKLVSGTDIH